MTLIPTMEQKARELQKNNNWQARLIADQSIELKNLKAQLAKKDQIIAELKRSNSMYAIAANWSTRSLGCADMIREDDLEQLGCTQGFDWNTGGKLAREVAERVKELEEENELAK